MLLLSIRRHSQVVRQSSAKAPPPVRVWVSPPKRKTRFSACLSFWVPAAFGRLHPSVIPMLGRSEFALRQGFRLRQNRLYGAETSPHRVGLSSCRIYSVCTGHKKHHTLSGVVLFIDSAGNFACPGKVHFGGCGDALCRNCIPWMKPGVFRV